MKVEPFDLVVAVDFSAAASPTSGANSIWSATSRAAGSIRTRNHRTRAALRDELRALGDGPDRVLVVLDVALGWPKGLAASLGITSTDPREATVRLLDEMVIDESDNSNNRFEVANELNRRSGEALFWGHPKQRRYSHLSATTTPLRGVRPRSFDGRRLVERVVGGTIKSPVQLAGAGSVGSQSMLAQVLVHRLRSEGVDLTVWPFEPPVGHLVIVEQFFTLAAWRSERGTCTDERQVRAVARELRGRACEEPSTMFEVTTSLSAADRAVVRHEEGWLLDLDVRGDKVR